MEAPFILKTATHKLERGNNFLHVVLTFVKHSTHNLFLTYSRILVAFVIYIDLSLGFVDTLIDCQM